VSPDGRTLASGSRDTAAVKLWDLGTRGNLTTFEDVLDDVSTLTFTRDGRTLIAGCNADDTGLLLEWSLDRNHLDGLNASGSRIGLESDGQRRQLDNGGGMGGATCVELFKAVHEHAGHLGFVSGYPTFRRTQSGDSSTVEAVFLRRRGAQNV